MDSGGVCLHYGFSSLGRRQCPFQPLITSRGDQRLEWTDEFITNAQHELLSLGQDWKYDYGTDDRDCAAMLLWMVLRLHPEADIDT